MDKLQNYLKDKRIVAGVVVLLIIILSGVFALSSHKQQNTQVATDNEVIPTVSPDKLGLKIQLGSQNTCQVVSSNNQVKFTLSNASAYKHVDGVFSYDADVPPSDQVEGGSGKVTQSFEMEKDITGSTFDSGFGLMGTCSKNVCRCDTGVQNIKLVLKLTGKDGKTYQSEASYNGTVSQ